MPDEYRHLRLERDARGVATVTFDVKDSPVNVFNEEFVRELQRVVEQLERDPPKAVVFRSGKSVGVPGRSGHPPAPPTRNRGRGSGRHRGRASVVRPRRAAAVPNHRGHSRAVFGRRAGVRTRVPSPRRPRRRADEARASRSITRADPRLGRNATTAAARWIAASLANDSRRFDAFGQEGRGRGVGRSRRAARTVRIGSRAVHRRPTRGAARHAGRTAAWSARCWRERGPVARSCSPRPESGSRSAANITPPCPRRCAPLKRDSAARAQPASPPSATSSLVSCLRLSPVT